MLIDWFTVVAQVFNFVVLVVALKFLLFDRVVEAMDRRQEAIRARAEEADARAEQAQEEAERLEAERAELRSERNRLLDEARERAEIEERELLDEARLRVEEQERRWRESLASRRTEFAGDLQRRVAAEAVSISRRALNELADSDLEERVVRTFVHRLDGLEDEEREELREALRSTEGPITVQTSFDLSEDVRGDVRSALHRVAGEGETEIEWDHRRDLSAGITVRVGPRTVRWTIDEYLDDLHTRFEDMLAEEEPEGAGEAVPAPLARDSTEGS